MEEPEYFGGEYISFIAFEDFTSLDLTEIKEKIPKGMEQEAYELIARFFKQSLKVMKLQEGLP